MTGIRVTPEQLQSLSTQVARGSSEIGAQLHGLAGIVAPLVGADWAGQAAQRFGVLWDDWQRSARTLQDALDGISALLGQAGVSYAQAEQQIAGSFR